MKVDKSLREVWDWKDKVYEETKHLSIRETARKIHEDAQQIKKKYGLKLKMLHLTEK
ncbi:MAG: hypothetical protein QMD94_04485 [Candidatus Omnitrophota bacterium]|nr:hypothetical protein [Candidatus Omnitrophota bacterium]